MKSVILFILSILIFLFFEELYFLYKYDQFLGYSFFEFLDNLYFFEYSIEKNFIKWLIIFSILTIFIVNLLSKLPTVVLSVLLAGFLYLFIASGSFYSLYEGYFIFKKVQKSKLDDLKYDSDIRFVCDKKRVIAHAGGKIDDKVYTDSLEALDNSYKKGFRYFELDIQKTRDGRYVAVHDWQEWKKMTNYKKTDQLPTLKEFKSLKIYQRYTPLDMQMINQWFKNHKDAFLVTDKIDEPSLFAKNFVDKDRLLMELFSIKSVLEAKKHGIKAMPTWDMVVRLMIRERSHKLKGLGIEYVAAPYDNFIDKEYRYVFKNFSENGIKVYLFGGYDKKIKPNWYYGRYLDDLNSSLCKLK